MGRNGVSGWILDVAGIFLISVLPLLIYLKHAGYSLVAPEILIIVGLILVISIVFGLVILKGRKPAHIIILTFMAVLVVDIQTDWITTLGLRLLLNSVFFGTLFWLFRNHLTRVIVIGAGLMVLTTLMLPGNNLITAAGEPAARPEDNPELPFVLHLILDAHIGIEGIPAEFDPKGAIAADFKNFYLDNSFAVHGRAYTRYAVTRESIPNLLNFAASDRPFHFLDRDFESGDLLKNNRWFDLLHERGYRIHLLETDYIRFYDREGVGALRFGDTFRSIPWASIKPVETAEMAIGQKVPFILSAYLGQSWMLSFLGPSYAELAFTDPGRSLGFPQWNLQKKYPSTLAAMKALDILSEQLSEAGPGQAYFAHIMLPHAPLGLDSNCNMETRPGEWLTTKNQRNTPNFNTTESRALKYIRYLEQTICLKTRLEEMFQIIKDKGLWEKAIIVVHGDHGSRLCRWVPRPDSGDNVIPEDYLDVYSTLFAIKGPGIQPDYDRRILPIDHLFTRYLRDGVSPGNPDLENRPHVFIGNGEGGMIKESLPFFANGRIMETPAESESLDQVNGAWEN